MKVTNMFNRVNIWGILAIIIVGLGIWIHILNGKLNSLKDSYSAEVNNNRALIHANDDKERANRTLKLTIEQLNSYNDSISIELRKAVKEAKVKEKNIQQLQYMLAHSSRRDTIVTRDTIFRDNASLDTLIKDKWYTLSLIARYPSTIVVEPTFYDEYKSIFHYSKETIKPPKRFFLWRIFQKKHIITNFAVINSNPYCSVDTLRMIEVIK